MVDARFSLFDSIKAYSSKGKGQIYFKKSNNRQKDVYIKSNNISRDPCIIAEVFDKIVKDSGWRESINAVNIFSDWEKCVGTQNAKSTIPQSLNYGVLIVKCDSTARATQFRIMEYDFIAAINSKIEGKIVKKIKFIGPQAPSWRKGIRHIKGRGPRDTYG